MSTASRVTEGFTCALTLYLPPVIRKQCPGGPVPTPLLRALRHLVWLLSSHSPRARHAGQPQGVRSRSPSGSVSKPGSFPEQLATHLPSHQRQRSPQGTSPVLDTRHRTSSCTRPVSSRLPPHGTQLCPEAHKPMLQILKYLQTADVKNSLENQSTFGKFCHVTVTFTG